MTQLCRLADRAEETLPLHYALLGWSQYAVDAHDTDIAACIGGGKGYTLVSKTIHGGMAVLVYTRDETVTSRVNDVRVAAVGCGPLFMGNKGAVGVRMVLGAAKSKYEDDDDLSDETYTFVCTHLAAHDHKVKRRNADWRSIVRRLVFTPDSMSRNKHFAPGKPRNPFHRDGRRVEQMQIWDTSYLFFFGDLCVGQRKITLTAQQLSHLEDDAQAAQAASRRAQDSQRPRRRVGFLSSLCVCRAECSATLGSIFGSQLTPSSAIPAGPVETGAEGRSDAAPPRRGADHVQADVQADRRLRLRVQGEEADAVVDRSHPLRIVGSGPRREARALSRRHPLHRDRGDRHL